MSFAFRRVYPSFALFCLLMLILLRCLNCFPSLRHHDTLQELRIAHLALQLL